jgi:hypothetical protein
MNEIEFLRSQVRLERRHLREVRAAWSARLDSACTDRELDRVTLSSAPYLLFALRRLAGQDSGHCERLRSFLDRNAEANPDESAELRAALAEVAQSLQQLHAARQRFEAAYQARVEGRLDVTGWIRACREFDSWYATQLAAQRHRLGHWLDAHYTLADWRSTSLVDAESILEERRLYDAALAALVSS